jgi:hypothetical protein
MSISQIKTGLRFCSLGGLYYEPMIVLLVKDEDKEEGKQTPSVDVSHPTHPTHLKTQSSSFSPPPNPRQSEYKTPKTKNIQQWGFAGGHPPNY